MTFKTAKQIVFLLCACWFFAQAEQPAKAFDSCYNTQWCISTCELAETGPDTYGACVAILEQGCQNMLLFCGYDFYLTDVQFSAYTQCDATCHVV